MYVKKNCVSVMIIKIKSWFIKSYSGKIGFSRTSYREITREKMPYQ